MSWREMVKRGATFFVNHSGGKDSQAMYLHLRRVIPKEQLVVIHSHLPEVDWPGCVEHIKDTIDVPYLETRARLTFFEMVRRRGLWPSPQYRSCTSQLKTGPLEKLIRQHVKQTGNPLVVSCVGIRAEESSQRAKATAWKYSEKNSKAGREWYDWLPIHEWGVERVFATIKQHDQEPHWAYQQGMTRLSCCFCIMSSKGDLQTAARLRPELYKQYVDLEREIDHTFVMPTKTRGRLFLPELTGVTI